MATLDKSHHDDHHHDDDHGWHALEAQIQELSLRVAQVEQENHRLEREVAWLRHRTQGKEGGVLVGQIAGSAGEGSPADLDEQGRVKVKVEFDGHDLELTAEVASPWLTPGGGVHLVPPTGTHVLVAFAQGDPRYPRVLAYLPNTADPLPYNPVAEAEEGTLAVCKDAEGETYNPQSANKYKTVLRSASDGEEAKKNEIVLVSQPGKEELSVAAQGNYRRYVGENNYLRVDEDCIASIGGNYEVDIKDEYKVEVHGEASFTVHGEYNYEYHGLSKEEHHQQKTEWCWGDVEELFMGAENSLSMGQKAEGHLGIVSEFSFLAVTEFKLAGIIDIFVGLELGLKLAGSTEFIFGVGIENVNGEAVKIINGVETTMVNGIAAEIIDGCKTTFFTVKDENGAVKVHEHATETGACALKNSADEILNKIGTVENRLAGMHIIT
ncbi:MAG: hypothetical protein KQJ78_16620 [Deltaproteobacteria bacterium]|nr:hypothetical protein [Deltaproteobacteria bacterium]